MSTAGSGLASRGPKGGETPRQMRGAKIPLYREQAGQILEALGLYAYCW